MPPLSTTPTRLPATRSRSRRQAASAAAPAPSATLWVSLNSARMAARISASEIVTTRSAPARISATASAFGTRTARPSARVSAESVGTGFPAANESA